MTFLNWELARGLLPADLRCLLRLEPTQEISCWSDFLVFGAFRLICLRRALSKNRGTVRCG